MLASIDDLRMIVKWQFVYIEEGCWSGFANPTVVNRNYAGSGKKDYKSAPKKIAAPIWVGIANPTSVHHRFAPRASWTPTRQVGPDLQSGLQ